MSGPMDAVLADPSRCRTFAPDVSVHWYASPDAERCICGAVTNLDAQEDA